MGITNAKATAQIKSVHETAGDVLLTSPSDMQTAASILNAI